VKEKRIEGDFRKEKNKAKKGDEKSEGVRGTNSDGSLLPVRGRGKTGRGELLSVLCEQRERKKFMNEIGGSKIRGKPP